MKNYFLTYKRRIAVIKRKDGFITRKIGSQIMAVPVGKRTNELHGMIALTESGELLWNALEKGCEEEDLVNIILDTYEIDRETAEADVKEYIEMLGEQGALL